ncbi:glycosyltransferase family 2 protein [Flammeovirgaceae bacterium SG7u.111]|nr:glycosyltransferase family 2 protein [Flammeovirgaceae bacterium SG7u.132]WPO34564.1 glycosyltransferase family 2 protein [Flammeovirgaceae bacterium SG7u.111]
MTLIIPAYNEEDVIAEKIINTLQLDYPKAFLDIWVVTDGSTDQTNNIVQSFDGVKLLYSPERKGKVAAINRAMAHIDSEIVVFSDANTILNRDALQHLICEFRDNEVGAVAGEKTVVTKSTKSSTGNGEGLYWSYESFLKKQDADFYSVVGAAGELFSMRTALFQPLEEDTILDDFMLSFQVNLQNYKVAYAPNAKAMELPSSSLSEERKRKVRISAGGFQAMSRLPQLWNITRHPLLSFQYFSHRVFRWTICPLALVLLLISNTYIALDSVIYFLFFLGQLGFYGLALGEHRLSKHGKSNKIAYIPYYFLFMNISVVQGALRFIKDQQPATWEKSKRVEGMVSI